MYLHKENRELFRDAILLASQELEVSEDIVEKDCYVTLILKKLSSIEYPVVFKGGTLKYSFVDFDYYVIYKRYMDKFNEFK